MDFDELLGTTKDTKIIDPVEVFNNLEKASDKLFLRPPQKSILEEWHNNHRNQKDMIIKLHTGQGKTLIGLE